MRQGRNIPFVSEGGGRKVRFGNGEDIIDPKKVNLNGDGRYKEFYSIARDYRKETTPVNSFSTK
ncbi:MAG: hypothetical protein ACYSTS_12705 [Planctomycetota bacterium]